MLQICFFLNVATTGIPTLMFLINLSFNVFNVNFFLRIPVVVYSNVLHVYSRKRIYPVYMYVCVYVCCSKLPFWPVKLYHLTGRYLLEKVRDPAIDVHRFLQKVVSNTHARLYILQHARLTVCKRRCSGAICICFR